ncbi:hypothetical protein E3N88_40756 [Mikania micrantha]|uniref:K+ potassium transporter integral membrane domain-containing protein n=1 Tax=Mikania micrantha TaxID=192012 RepID=A0A5N6LNL9_9ASTR|nr:hypothetical protein E3N88_40756 [Mikania micrantha]
MMNWMNDRVRMDCLFEHQIEHLKHVGQLVMDLETGFHQIHPKKQSWMTVLTLAYQSLGVVYGDLSTSPLYVFKIFIVLKADDNGEGGTFALYSLLCRHARVSSLPNCQLADEELSSYKSVTPNLALTSFGSRLKSTLEKYRVLQRFLLVLALVGACMVIGDGVLNSCAFRLCTAGFNKARGQAAYLSQHHVIENDYRIGFYISVPKHLRVPVLCLIAILAAVVGSQAIITGTFSIYKTMFFSRMLSKGQNSPYVFKVSWANFIPEINWILMSLCLAVTIGFRDTKRMGNASDGKMGNDEEVMRVVGTPPRT